MYPIPHLACQAHALSILMSHHKLAIQLLDQRVYRMPCHTLSQTGHPIPGMAYLSQTLFMFMG